jgi:hypothetical protein
VYSRPAHAAPNIPATRLICEKPPGLMDKLAIPPINADNAPKYAPRMIPIRGTIIAARVMNWKAPMRRNMGRKERTTYRAAKHAANATSFAPSFLKTGIPYHPRV